MTVSQYLDLAYAVVVDERVRRGQFLYDALDETREYAAGSKGIKVTTAGGNTTRRAGQSVEDMNNESMATLMGAMKNVQGGFR